VHRPWSRAPEPATVDGVTEPDPAQVPIVDTVAPVLHRGSAVAERLAHLLLPLLTR
jgi:hypothetical protein